MQKRCTEQIFEILPKKDIFAHFWAIFGPKIGKILFSGPKWPKNDPKMSFFGKISKIEKIHSLCIPKPQYHANFQED